MYTEHTGCSFRLEEPASLRSCCFFFFSSRRRHTRFDCDWSSDVCSSDLSVKARGNHGNGLLHLVQRWGCKVSNRSEEHTSELQSQSNLVCRLLLEKKKKKRSNRAYASYTYTSARLSSATRTARSSLVSQE